MRPPAAVLGARVTQGPNAGDDPGNPTPSLALVRGGWDNPPTCLGAPRLALKSLSELVAVLTLKIWCLLLTCYLQPRFHNICLVLNKYAFQLLNGLLSIFNPERVMSHE